MDHTADGSNHSECRSRQCGHDQDLGLDPDQVKIPAHFQRFAKDIIGLIGFILPIMAGIKDLMNSYGSY
jgi:hypothetical protein